MTINGSGGDDNIGPSNGTTSGADTVNGRGGDDTITTGNGGDTIKAGDGNDTVQAGGGSDNVVGGNGDDTISGGANQDRIEGNKGEDILDGGSSNDVLRAGKGNDYLAGGGGNDTMFGGKGSDLIDGGNGDDIMWATNETVKDNDIDYFLFDAADGNDTVYKFDKGVDQIYLFGDDNGDGTGPGGTATFVLVGSDTLMTYNSTTVLFKNVDLTTPGDYFADTQAIRDWGDANYDDPGLAF